MKKFAAIVCAILLVGCAAFGAIQLPFDPTKAVQGNLVIVGDGVCPGNVQVAVILSETPEGTFRILFAESTKRVVVIQFDAKGQPIQVIFGELQIVDGKPVVKAVQAMTIEKAKVKYADPCAWLAEKDV